MSNTPSHFHKLPTDEVAITHEVQSHNNQRNYYYPFDVAVYLPHNVQSSLLKDV